MNRTAIPLDALAEFARSPEIAGRAPEAFAVEEVSEWGLELRRLRQLAESEVRTASPKVQEAQEIPLATLREPAER